MSRAYPTLYTVRDVATRLRVCEDTIYKLARVGEWEGGRVGRQFRFTRNDIDKMRHQRKSSTK